MWGYKICDVATNPRQIFHTDWSKSRPTRASPGWAGSEGSSRPHLIFPGKEDGNREMWSREEEEEEEEHSLLWGIYGVAASSGMWSCNTKFIHQLWTQQSLYLGCVRSDSSSVRQQTLLLPPHWITCWVIMKTDLVIKVNVRPPSEECAPLLEWSSKKDCDEVVTQSSMTMYLGMCREELIRLNVWPKCTCVGSLMGVDKPQILSENPKLHRKDVFPFFFFSSYQSYTFTIKRVAFQQFSCRKQPSVLPFPERFPNRFSKWGFIYQI